MASEKVQTLTDGNFTQVIGSVSQPVLVDFWAEWCGPCKQIAPALEELSNEIKGLTIAKLNVDDNPGMAAKYGVRGIPTMMIFQHGQVAATKVGAIPKGKIEEWIKSTI